MQPERLVPPAESFACHVVEQLTGTGRPPLTILSGPSGVELRSCVEEICHRLEDAGEGRVVVVNLSFGEPPAGSDLASRVPPLSVLRGRPGTVLVFKNAHRLPVDALGTLEALVRQVANTGTRCVCAVALPLRPETRAAFRSTFERLRADDLVQLMTLRPVPRRRVSELVTSLISALPEPALCEALWVVTRGWPNVLATALRMGGDLMSVVDRHAYLTPWRGQFQVPANEELLADVRALGATSWDVAKAIAAFGLLGPAAPRLVAESLGLTEHEATTALGELARAGVLQHVRAGSAWRFRVPLVGFSLEATFGPYERRRLAQIAVTALWQGTARCDIDTYLPDQLVRAGRLVDPCRARAELLTSAGLAAVDSPNRSLSWLRAAAELTTDRAERVRILLTHARTCLLCGEAKQALESTGAVLGGDAEEIGEGQLVNVCLLHLTALHESGDIATLEQVAEDGWWPWPGTPLEQAVGRAYALALLGHWRQTRELLEKIRQDPDAALVGPHVNQISPITGLWLGDCAEFDHAVTNVVARVEAGERPHSELRWLVGTLMTLGEQRRAEVLLALSDRVHIPLKTACQTALAAAHGRATEALQLTRKSVATGARNGCDADQTAMFHLAATVQLYRGKLSRALALIATARDRTPVLPHLLALTEASHERLFGRHAAAREVLAAALRQADEAGVIALTDLLWTSLADIAVDLGERRLMPDLLERVEAVAKCMGTEQAELNRLTIHAAVHDDHAVAGQAVALLRERGQPLELVSGLERLVRFGVAAPELLLEAYAAAGGLQALMCRAWLRNLMRTHGISVPGRQETVAENERLLATLVADGLGNKQIAILLGASEKSVEGRLSRMFSRAGYRSRVELASAMLTGGFPG